MVRPWSKHSMISILPVKPATARASRIFFLITRLHGVWCTQGSVLGAILFLLYCGDLHLIIESHGLCQHLHAGDSQIYGSCRPAAYTELQSRVSTCIDHVQWRIQDLVKGGQIRGSGGLPSPSGDWGSAPPAGPILLFKG